MYKKLLHYMNTEVVYTLLILNVLDTQRHEDPNACNVMVSGMENYMALSVDDDDDDDDELLARRHISVQKTTRARVHS